MSWCVFEEHVLLRGVWFSVKWIWEIVQGASVGMYVCLSEGVCAGICEMRLR